MRRSIAMLAAAVAMISPAYATVTQFNQSYFDSQINYAVDDTALTVTFQPLTANVYPIPPNFSTANEIAVAGAGETKTFDVNKPGTLPITTQKVTVSDSITIDSYSFAFSPLTTFLSQPETRSFSIPVSGTTATLSTPVQLTTLGNSSSQGVIGHAQASGHWALNVQAESEAQPQSFSGVFDLGVDLLTPPCTDTISGINLAGFPSSAQLDINHGGQIFGSCFNYGFGQAQPLLVFSQIVDGLPITLSTIFSANYIDDRDPTFPPPSVYLNAYLSPLPIPGGAILLASAMLALPALRRNRRK